MLAVLLLLTTPKGDMLVELPWGYIGSDSVLVAVVTAIRLEAAAIAAEVRGFNLRTHESGYKRYPMTGTDWAVVALGVAVLAVAIALSLI